MPNLSWLFDLPNGLFNPSDLSFISVFNNFPPKFALKSLQCLLILSLVSILFDKTKMVGGIIFSILSIIISGFVYSLGKIDHMILYPLTALFFSLNNWEERSFKNELKLLPIPSETILAIFIAFAFFTTGILKAYTWLDLDVSTSGYLFWHIPIFLNGGNYLLANYTANLPIVVYEILDYVAILFELAPFIVLFSGKKTLWKLWIFIACVFHFINVLFLNISFYEHIMVYLCFILVLNNKGVLIKLLTNKIFKIAVAFIAFLQIVFVCFLEKPILFYYLSSEKSQLIFYSVIWFCAASLAFLVLLSKNRTINSLIK